MSSAAGPERTAGARPAYAAVRARLGLVAALFAVAALGWVWTAEQMRGMDDGPWTALGGLIWFLGIWIVMMAAMMFPSVAPTIALYTRVTKDEAPIAPWLFAGGYLLTWTLAGLLAYAVGHIAVVASGRHPDVGPGRTGARRHHPDRRRRLRDHPAQERMSGEVPHPARLASWGRGAVDPPVR